MATNKNIHSSLPTFIRSQQLATMDYFAHAYFPQYFVTFLINNLKFLRPKEGIFPMPKNVCNITFKLVLVIRIVDFPKSISYDYVRDKCRKLES